MQAIINDVDVRIEFFLPEKKSKAEQPRNMEFAQKGSQDNSCILGSQ